VLDNVGASKADEDDWFNLGLITWKSGANLDLKSEVLDWDSTAKEVEIQFATPFDITVGDTFDISPGCDKLKQTCIDKFDNLVNHGGFPFIPGTDQMLQTPR